MHTSSAAKTDERARCSSVLSVGCSSSSSTSASPTPSAPPSAAAAMPASSVAGSGAVHGSLPITSSAAAPSTSPSLVSAASTTPFASATSPLVAGTGTSPSSMTESSCPSHGARRAANAVSMNSCARGDSKACRRDTPPPPPRPPLDDVPPLAPRPPSPLARRSATLESAPEEGWSGVACTAGCVTARQMPS